MKRELYISITERLRELIRGTEFEGHVLSVGGCVRDDIMGQEIKDIDLAVSLPDGGIRLAEWLDENGYTAFHVVTYPTYHTAMFHLKDYPDVELETVQTRKEKYNDHNSRNPITAFGTIEEDCMRRDLTINALYRNISTGEVIDITGHGVDDIRDHIIRTPADPDLTYDDDPLRILRCVRFASRYGWAIEPVTWEGMLRNVPRLEIISRERIRDEFEKMLSCDHPMMAMELLRQSGAMHFVVPELEKAYEMNQNDYHFGTVWEHTMKVLENISAVTNNPDLRLAALLHDIGKVRTREESEDGSVHFINHELAGADMVKEIMARLKFPNRAIDNVSFLTLYHMMCKPWEGVKRSRLDRLIRRLQYMCKTEKRFDELMTLIHADNMAHAEGRCLPDQVPFIRMRTNEMIAEGSAMFEYKLWLTGNEIMEIKGMSSGPKVKECQEFLLKLAFVNPLRDKEEVIKHLKGYKLKKQNKMNEFDKIRKDGRLLYEYIRGSHLYGLNTETSDVDTSGVFICTADQLMGCFGYKAQVSDHRHDNTWYEIGELVRLLLKSNPTVLESLFVPEDKMFVKPAPLMQLLIDNRDQFISKQCFNPFFGYAKSQIEKARGLNKKIVNPVDERLTAYHFIYTFKGQGSTRFKDWLQNRGLYQEYCGLVNVPNMHDIYGVYYDFGAHTEAHPEWREDLLFVTFACEYFGDNNIDETRDRLSAMQPIGYRGVIKADAKADEIRLSSIEDKHSRPMCFIYYNKDGYSVHCRQYAEYQEWVKNRNQARYESNLEKNYDSKNMMHCFRLMHMASEIAEGKGLVLQRTWDRQFLMDVRSHKFEYDEIIAMLEQEKERMNQLMEQSSIRERIDTEFVNSLMIEIRKRQLQLT